MTHDEMVALITDVRSERDRLAVEFAAERERAQHLDDVRQVLERDKGILAAELAEARREVSLYVHRGDQSEGMLKVAVRELDAERETHARTREELTAARLNRVGQCLRLCSWCGAEIAQPGTPPEEAAEASQQHAESCPSNPYMARIKRGEAVIAGLREWLEIASGLDSHIYGGRAAMAGEVLAKLAELERGA